MICEYSTDILIIPLFLPYTWVCFLIGFVFALSLLTLRFFLFFLPWLFSFNFEWCFINMCSSRQTKQLIDLNHLLYDLGDRKCVSFKDQHIGMYTRQKLDPHISCICMGWQFPYNCFVLCWSVWMWKTFILLIPDRIRSYKKWSRLILSSLDWYIQRKLDWCAVK